MYGIKIGKEKWVFRNANHFTRAVIDTYDYGYKIDDAFPEFVNDEDADDAIEFEEWLRDGEPKKRRNWCPLVSIALAAFIVWDKII